MVIKYARCAVARRAHAVPHRARSYHGGNSKSVETPGSFGSTSRRVSPVSIGLKHRLAARVAKNEVHFRTNSDLNHSQEDIGSGQSFRFFVVEHLSTIAKNLQLAESSVAYFHRDSLLGCRFPQAHGRASQVKSKEAAFDFNHGLQKPPSPQGWYWCGW